MPGTAAALAVASLYAADAARDAARVSAMQDSAMSLPQLVDVNARRSHTLHPVSCDSCGSQEFRRWQGVSVCSYCRSVADAPTTRATPTYDRYVSECARDAMDDAIRRIAKLDGIRYADHLGITRPQAHARLTTE